MDPCPFVRILIGDLALRFAAAAKPPPPHTAGVGVHPSSSPCFCKVKLKGFPTQTASVPDLTVADAASAASARSLAASFSLDRAQIEAVAAAKPRIKISVFAGRRGGGCGLVGAGNAKLIGKVVVPVDLSVAQSKPCVFHNGWVSIGDQSQKKKNSASSSSSSSSSQIHLCVRAEPDPRFVFRFDGEPECSPQVFQVQGNVKQPVFTCKFGFRSNSDLKNSSMSETSTSRSWMSSLKSNKESQSKERKGWSITIHDLSGSPVAVASMVTPFVASPGSDRVSRSNPGAWLILRPGDATWKPWGRLEAWRERGMTESVGYKFELLTDAAPTTLAGGTVGAAAGGKFTIDVTSSLVSPMNSPQSSFDFGSASRSRPGSGSGSDFGFSPYRGFVMSSTVEGVGKKNRPEVEVGVQHVTCSEDAAAFVAVAAAMDLSMDACRLFSEKLPKELRQ